MNDTARKRLLEGEEFPAFLIPPLFIISTLPAAILYRRKHSILRGC